MPGMKSEKIIFVYADWMSTEPQLMGRLYVSESRGKEIFSFEYDESWLNKDRGMFFDPDLYLYAGRQYAPMDKNQFGIFSDSSPDRWGRTLMNRREAIRARKEERKPKKLTESDYLLGVYDATRMGALRFSLEEHGDFLSNDTELAAPPWTTLRTLEAASLSFEEGGADSDEEKWLKINGFLEFLREQMVKTWERKLSLLSHALRNTFYQRSAWWIADGRPVRWSCLPVLLPVTAE